MSALGLGLGLGLGAHRKVGDSTSMILVYEIPATNTTIKLAIQANSTYFSDGQAVVINWGDGSATETVSATSQHTGYIGHTYAAARTYTIKISGSMTMYGRDSAVNIAGQAYLTHVDSFGKLGITSLAYAFYKCTGLMAVPKTLPDSVLNMSNTFRACCGDAFNPNFSNWDVSKVTAMNSMFSECSGVAFNPDVTNWKVSKVSNMGYMFYGCSRAAFNPNMKSWTLKTGVYTGAMFTASKIQPTTWLDELLIAWAANSKHGNNITIDFSPNKFSETTEGEPIPAVADALQTLEGKRWTIATANPYSTP